MAPCRYGVEMYAVLEVSRMKDGTSMLNGSGAHSDWNDERMSMTAICSWVWLWSELPPRCEWTMEDPFEMWVCWNMLIPQ